MYKEWWIDEFVTKNVPWEFWAEVPNIKMEHPELYWLVTGWQTDVAGFSLKPVAISAGHRRYRDPFN